MESSIKDVRMEEGSDQMRTIADRGGRGLKQSGRPQKIKIK